MRISFSTIIRVAIWSYTFHLIYSGKHWPDTWMWLLLSVLAWLSVFLQRRQAKAESTNTHPEAIALPLGKMGYIGTKQQFLNYFGGMDLDPERISMVAIKTNDGMIYAVDSCAHSHECHDLRREYRKDVGIRYEHGFITSYGEYIDTRRAVKIAKLAGQIVAKTYPPNELFCRDIWPKQALTGKVLSKKEYEAGEANWYPR